MKLKVLKIGIPLVMIGVIAFGWLNIVASAARDAAYHASVLASAEQSYEDGLYQQCILQYKEALAAGSGAEVYERMLEVYRTYYNEEHDDGVYASYLNDMTDAYMAYPDRVEFWEAAFDLYMEYDEMDNVYTLCKEALNNNVPSERMAKEYDELCLTTETDNDDYTLVKTALNGYLTVFDGEVWTVVDGSGSAVGGAYEVAGPLNDLGTGLYKGAYDPRLIDAGGVVRKRFDISLADAGLYDSESGIIAVRTDAEGGWRYLNTHTGELGEAEYEQAGTYGGGYAAVKMEGGWYLVDQEGKVVSDPFEEIRLDPHGRYVQGDTGLVFAKRDGAFALYDAGLNRVGDFTCDDIDMYVDGPVAFARDGRWGFYDLGAGTVVCEPTYQGARSFSLGRAAASEGASRWGFVDESFEPVTHNEFREAYYFTSNGNALVSDAEGTYTFMSYQYT